MIDKFAERRLQSLGVARFAYLILIFFNTISDTMPAHYPYPCFNDLFAGSTRENKRNTYFPLRKGESVTLYQDAHGHDGLLPKIELDEGRLFKQHPCWEDICYVISEAHHTIYLAGWSIYHKVKLIREPTRPLPRGSDLNLGELLRYKSQEGV